MTPPLCSAHCYGLIVWLIVFVLSHPIAHTYLCIDVFRLCRICLDLTPYSCHIDPQDLVVVIRIGTPYTGQDGGIGDYLSGILRKKGNDLILNRSEVHFL